MQCSACLPTSSERTRVRPLSSKTTWNSCGPSPSVTPVQTEVYGFIRSPVDERGRSWRKTSRSANRGSSFSIPRIDTRTGGRVVHIRPFPSDSTMQTAPVSAMPKLAPLTPTRASRNRSRRYRRAASARSAGSFDVIPGAIVRAKRSRISLLLRWIAGTRMCDGQSPSSWRISSAKSVSSAWMPTSAHAPLSSISSVVRDFIFTTSSAP